MVTKLNTNQSSDLTKVDLKPTGLKRLIHLWIEGARVSGRLIWFMINFSILMLPIQLLVTIVNPSHVALFDNGRFDPRAGLTLVIFILCLPFACVIASRISRYLGDSNK